LEIHDIIPTLKPLGTTQARLATPKVFHLKAQPVEDAKAKKVTHMVRRCCIYFFPCSQQVQQQIWADEHQQTSVPTIKEGFMSTWSWFRNPTET